MSGDCSLKSYLVFTGSAFLSGQEMQELKVKWLYLNVTFYGLISNPWDLQF